VLTGQTRWIITDCWAPKRYRYRSSRSFVVSSG